MNVLKILFFFMLMPHFVVNSALAGDERSLLTSKDGYLGGFSKVNSKKVSGKIDLEIYNPYIDNIVSHGLPDINKTKRISIEYDEIWERKRTDYLTNDEIKKYEKDLDIILVYFKNNRIQACVVKKKFVANPLTNQNFSAPEYKITSLETREEVMKNY